MTPIEQIEQLMAEVKDLKAKLDESTGKLNASQIDSSKIAELQEAYAKFDKEASDKSAEIVAIVKERDELKAETEKLKAAMALKPEAFAHITDGTKPVADGSVAAEKPLVEKLSELSARGDHAAARELYKSHKAEFKKLGITSPKN